MCERGLENAIAGNFGRRGAKYRRLEEDALAAACGGDMRKALGSLEFAVAGAAGTDRKAADNARLEMIQVAQRSGRPCVRPGRR